MSGLYGIGARIPGLAVKVTDLRKINNTLAHRGPDDEGYFVDQSGGPCLAMRRLGIIDPYGASPDWQGRWNDLFWSLAHYERMHGFY